MLRGLTLQRRSLLAIGLGLGLGLLASLGVSVLAERLTALSLEVSAVPRSDDARLLAEVIERVKGEYVDRVDDQKLMQHAVRGLVANLDAYSAYLDRDEYTDIRETTAGSYPGVGIEVSADQGGIKVVRTLPQSPAERADLRPGDLIVGIDRRPVGGNLEAAIDRMRGEPGTQVSLSVRRPGASDVLDLSLQRAQVEIHNVAAVMLEHDVAYVRIAGFSANTPNDLRNSIEQLRSSHANKLAGVIVDLRNNPGGVLESAVEIADELLDRGVIVIAQGRTAEARFRMQAERGQLLAGVPLAVLINGASASAAEILAAALRDNGRATLVGRRTFGKGTVQTVIPLSGGRALKLTTSRYLTPRGVSIQDLGIAPDVAVEGIDEPPAGIGAPDSLPLAHRDRDVRIALDHLRAQRHRLAQAG